MRGPEAWLEWLSPDHLLGRIVVASVEFLILALVLGIVLALVARTFRAPSGRWLACAWGVVFLKPLVTLALGTPIPLLRVAEAPLETRLALDVSEARLVGDVAGRAPGSTDGALSAASVGDDARSTEARGASAEADAATTPAATVTPRTRELDLRSLLLGAWALGVLVLGVRWIRAHLALRRLVRSSEELPGELWREIRSGLSARERSSARTARESATLERASSVPNLPGDTARARARVFVAKDREVEVRVTRELESPSLVGLARPTILVPAWLVEQRRADWITWALRHEMAHARWFDPIAIAVRDAVSVVLFFHPLLPWVRRRHADAMESACDWEAVRDVGEAASYAEGLGAILASIRTRRRAASPAEALAMVAHGSTSRRVEALLAGRRPGPMTIRSALALALVAGAVFTFGCGATRDAERGPDGDAPLVAGAAPDAGADPRAAAGVPNERAVPGSPPDQSARVAALLEPSGVDRAVQAGLRWLARHQDDDGAWRPASIATKSPDADASFGPHVPYTKNYDAGLTALALTCFLDAGLSETSTKTWVDSVSGRRLHAADVIRKAVARLMADQEADGSCAPGRPFMYNEALVASALAKAYASSRDPLQKAAAQRAITFVQDAQRPAPNGEGLWGWRYASRQEVESFLRPGEQDENQRRELHDSDTSITGWCTAALATAAASGLDVRRENLDGALAFTKWVSAPDGQVGYISAKGAGATVTGPGDHFVYHAASMSAMGILTRMHTANRLDDPFLALAAKWIVADAPRISDDKLSIDYYYWHFGLVALTAIDGPRVPQRTGALWGAWSTAAAELLLALQDQQPSPGTNGAWLVPDRWSHSGGPLYTTSMNVLTLVAYLRGTGSVEGALVR